jgi:formate/nitrite transporter
MIKSMKLYMDSIGRRKKGMASKILVIDDEEIVGQSLRKTFKDEGYEIDTAHSGQEGLRKARRETFDLMIVDLKMPDISGLDVIKKLKEEQPDTMMVMITGYSTVDSATEALKTGAFDYIPKPFTPEEISEVVQKALETKQRLAKEKEEQEALRSLRHVEISTSSFEAKSPAAVAESVAQKVGVGKATASWFNLAVLGILAGVYIGFGAALATTVTFDSSNFLGAGVSKLLAGSVFSVGLMLVVIAGAELFTGNNLIMASVLGGHTRLSKLFRNWIIVYIANFVGSMLLVGIMYGTKLWTVSNAATGSTIGIKALSTANAKVNLTFWAALFRGIGCNWLVCLAVWMALSSRDVTGKIFGIFFPIMAFVAMGYEHCIANMYFIPMGIFLKNTAMAAQSGLDLTNLTWWGGFVVRNLIPVTIGNIIGGSIFVALLYWSVYQRKERREPATA